MTSQPRHPEEPPPPAPPAPIRGSLFTWVIGLGFLVLAALFIFERPGEVVPRGDMRIVARELFAPGARRQHVGEPPTVVIGGFAHACNECHRLFDSPPVEHRTLTQHTQILFDHGMNNRCFNCHDRGDRERLVLHDGTLIGFDQVPRLCAQCHGTVYRDWQRGTHGKTMGSWDASGGKQHRLGCNDCHDPHAPAYRPIAPLPGPSTLRMGDQSQHDEEPGRHTPLRRPDPEPRPAKPAPPTPKPKEDAP